MSYLPEAEAHKRDLIEKLNARAREYRKCGHGMPPAMASSAEKLAADCERLAQAVEPMNLIDFSIFFLVSPEW